MSSRASSQQSARPNQPSLQWSGPGNITTFVRCLHLLNLDLRSDWPGVSEQTFTAKSVQQNLQHRIKAVEWSLYRLFEIYDPVETKDKLGPFFPPSAPLQSVNLRAALYRCLTELKKSGALGRDILLRKTMLDDCRGDRFEEVVASFAMAVLRKVTKTKSTHVLDVYKGDGTQQQVVALILAHRKTLQTNLHIRKQLKESAAKQMQDLDMVEQNLKQRRAQVMVGSPVVDQNVVRQQQTLVHTNWIGDHAWADILLHGESPQQTSILQETVNKDENASGLLDELNAKIQEHNTRLEGWKILAKDLMSKQLKYESATSSTIAPKGRSSTTQFMQHKQLNLSRPRVDAQTQTVVDPVYERLLAAMNEELARPKKGSKLEVTRPGQDSLITAVAEHDQEVAVQDSLESEHQEIERESIAEPVDTHNSDEFRDDEAREDDMFDTRSSEGDISPIVSDYSPIAIPKVRQEKLTQGNVTTSSPLSGIVNDESTESSWIPAQRSVVTTIRPATPTISTYDGPLLSKTNSQRLASPTEAWMNLTERTRVSMSSLSGRLGLEDESSSPDTPPEEPAHQREMTDSPLKMKNDRQENRLATLMDRTRQSMSLVPNQVTSRPAKIPKDSRMSQVYPVNQFETSAQYSHHTDVAPHAGRSTPRETLFDDTADYESVFKSRPKIALSPALSPERSQLEMDSMLGRGMANLDLDSA